MSVQTSDLKYVFSIIVDLMSEVGNMRKLTGKQKKDYVLEKLKEHITLDNSVEDLIIYLVDTLISVEKGNIVFNPKIKKYLLCC